jgi:hypothetical protein
MAMNLEKEPDYNTLLQTLLQKTREGKLVWQETADASTFLAAVRGERTFEINLVVSDASDYVQGVRLLVRDSEGKLLFDVSMPHRAPASSLYDLAKRIATRVDEKIDSTMELLGSL